MLKVSYYNQEQIRTVILPDKAIGKYSISDHVDVISIEGRDEIWEMTSLNGFLVNNKETKVNLDMSQNSFFTINHEELGPGYLITTVISPINTRYKNYIVDEGTEILIGRSKDSTIVFNNESVSSNHAKLTYFNGEWSLEDLNSTNGTYVNDVRKRHDTLSFGDKITIIETEIVVGSDFISIKDPWSLIAVKNELAPMGVQQDDDNSERKVVEEPEVTYYYRTPRFKRGITNSEFAIDNPPSPETGNEMPLMMVLGPSITMGMATMATSIFSISQAMASGNMSSAIPSIVMAVSMLLGTIMWPLLTKRYEKKNNLKKEKKRLEKYRAYLHDMQRIFAETCVHQQEILHENYPSPYICEKVIINKESKLWERGYSQDDFLSLRMGLGTIPMIGDVRYQEEQFTVEKDILDEELLGLGRSARLLEEVPITYSLMDNRVTGVFGENKDRLKLIDNLIVQMLSYFAYDELKIIIVDENFEANFGFLRNVGHIWSQESSTRFIVNDISSAKEVSSYFEKIYDETNEERQNVFKDHYVIISNSSDLSKKFNILSKIYEMPEKANFSIIHMDSTLQNLPKECDVVIEVSEETSKMFRRDDISGNHIEFAIDKDSLNFENIGQIISNTHLDIDDGGQGSLPTMLTFLDMFNAGKVEHLNILNRWKENDPTLSLEAEIGVNGLGDSFKLDLHEKFQGPHGLVAGMTGSGKSEFIITYILSLAVNYHPNEVAFILIDYKGGGMAKAFETLPHTAGIITNLDGAAVNRSLVSIQSELKRRQAIFTDTSTEIGVSNIDIYKYQKLFREGKVKEPLQHLFIISDEFAELKTQQPEFMEQLISAARIGRSLGVHLILATQKPAGVVDDQIWSNSKFRVCLKVQEKEDSMDMLKRPDAAELTVTGRFYLQVGYNELFEMGQSAWAGANYAPTNEIIEDIDISASQYSDTGQILKQVKIDSKQNAQKTDNKQLDTITKHLESIATSEKISIRKLWLEPIAEKIYLSDLFEKYSIPQTDNGFILNPLIGEYDDPASQAQHALHLPITTGGNAAIFGISGSGRTIFLNTLTQSIIQTYSPKNVSLFLVDFASETMGGFKGAPHVRDVVFTHEEEKVKNLFKLLSAELKQRKAMFTEFGGDYTSYARNAKNIEIPQILILMNNYVAFTELYEDYEDEFIYLTREGSKYGITFIVTALGPSSIRFRMQQNFKQSFTLQLSDEGEYQGVVGRTDGLYPQNFRGRGLIQFEEVHELQIALINDDFNFSDMKSCSQTSIEKWGEGTNAAIPVLPETVTKNVLKTYYSDQNPLKIPVGINVNSLNPEYINLRRSYIQRVLSMDEQYKRVGNAIIEQNYSLDINSVVFDLENEFNVAIDHENICTKGNEIIPMVSTLFDETVKRNNETKDALQQGVEAPIYDHLNIVITGLKGIYSILDEQDQQKLNLIFQKGQSNFNMSIVFIDNAGGLSDYTYEDWYREQVDGSSGIWLGNGITDQSTITTSSYDREMYKELQKSMGYVVQRGQTKKTKFIEGGGIGE